MKYLAVFFKCQAGFIFYSVGSCFLSRMAVSHTHPPRLLQSDGASLLSWVIEAPGLGQTLVPLRTASTQLRTSDRKTVMTPLAELRKGVAAPPSWNLGLGKMKTILKIQTVGGSSCCCLHQSHDFPTLPFWLVTRQHVPL